MYCPLCKEEYPEDWKRCPKHETELLASSYVGKYRIDDVIGTGGMGAVYRAFNPDTSAPVAIKMMHGAASSDEAARARFQREAAAIAALRTAHVVTIYDFGSEPDGTLYLVMELLEGHNLRAEVDAPPGQVAVPRVNMILGGSLRGLGAAHRAGVTHRDLKPENIFIADTDDGEVAKVLDFGIARVDAAGASNLTKSGALMGTPAYMAPEQIAGNRGEIGAWTDVYSMGIILYEMLAGKAPFTADTVTATFGRILAREYTPLREVRPDLPESVHGVVERAIADDPRERFPHADGLRNAWQSAFGAFPPEVQAATVPTFARAAGAAARPGATEKPSADLATDWGSAPTVTPAHGHAGASPIAHQPTQTAERAARGTHESVTPGPVVVEGGDRPGGRGGLLAMLAVVAVAGIGVGAFFALRDTGNGAAGGAAGSGSDAGIRTAADAAPPPAPAIDARAAVPATPAGMVRLEGGTFEMGTPARFARFRDADPRHEVSLAPYFLDENEMTNAAYADLVPGADVGGPGDHPVTGVSWDEAAAACAAAGKRLPGEAEWEFAATRGPLDAAGARMHGEGIDGPAPAGSHPRDCTPQGVCDLLGNVAEWTADVWRQGGEVDADERARTVRGASFRVAPDEAMLHASPHARIRVPADTRDPEVGFRCARDAPRP